MPRPHREIASSSKVNVAGACAGATTLAALLGYYAASSDQSPVNCATMLVAVLDTEVESTMLLFATQDTIRSMHVDRSELNRRLRASGGHGYYLQLLATVGWTSVLWLPALRPQTLIMMGADDPIVPVVNGRLWQRLFRARLVTIADGHLFLVTSVRECAPIVADFLTGQSNSRASVGAAAAVSGCPP